ncbi:MAG: hypothetical protein ACJAYN_001082 [Bermanella sp.]|jgi:hypothetical protein|uniref:hypothetical protein n=1 Tax=Glaciecola sp. 33A TaxID=2057807 RepID=UPI000C34C2C9|nr:hypothetical protein [Glaciecola sp. 33A]PKI02789.1 hypothetical protein CXF81_04635 [Glaciecola sp. 33A]
MSTRSKQHILTILPKVRDIFFGNEKSHDFFNLRLLVIKRQDVGKIKGNNSVTMEINMLSAKFKSKLLAPMMRIVAIWFEEELA